MSDHSDFDPHQFDALSNEELYRLLRTADLSDEHTDIHQLLYIMDLLHQRRAASGEEKPVEQALAEWKQHYLEADTGSTQKSGRTKCCRHVAWLAVTAAVLALAVGSCALGYKMERPVQIDRPGRDAIGTRLHPDRSGTPPVGSGELPGRKITELTPAERRPISRPAENSPEAGEPDESTPTSGGAQHGGAYEIL